MNKKIAADVYTQTASDGYILRPAAMEEVPAIWEIILQATTPTTTTSTCSASSPASASPTAAASATMPASAWRMRKCCADGWAEVRPGHTFERAARVKCVSA